MAAQTELTATTQDFLEIEDIKDDLIIFRDGSVSLVLETTAVNFGLLSEEEQEAIIYTYAALLNSLSFSVQIAIVSRQMDISSYLDLVAQEEEKQTSGKIKSQLQRYYQFILAVVKENRVLEKKFYFIIPFSPLELGLKAASSFLPSRKKLPFPKEYIISRAKTSLFPKRDHLLRQLVRIGLKARQLTTQQIIEVFYNIFNPKEAGTAGIAESYTSFLIEGKK